MSIDPKKGGLCWACKHCEDIATQTNNDAGAYYRKCTKSGHDYVDTCKFYCSDYVWDGKHDEYAPASSAPSPSGCSTSAPKAAASGTSKVGFKLISVLLTTAVFGFIGYLLLGYAEYLLAAAIVDTATLPIFDDAFLIEAILVMGPFLLTVIWSIIRRRKIWVGALLTMIACTVINGMIGEDTTPAHIPLFIASAAIPYLLCLAAILKDKKNTVSTSAPSAPSTRTSTAASPAAARSYTDYKCYQCAYYKVDEDYNGICARHNRLVDRYQTACKDCSR